MTLKWCHLLVNGRCEDWIQPGDSLGCEELYGVPFPFCCAHEPITDPEYKALIAKCVDQLMAIARDMSAGEE